MPPLQASPDFKGIKTIALCLIHVCMRLQASPDFKGIKTEQHDLLLHPTPLQASPDFKGIKTSIRSVWPDAGHASSQP